MAVYKRAYRPYEGPRTDERWRFLVLARQGLRELAESRVVIGFVLGSLVPFLIEAAGVYVWSSAPARLYFRLPGAASPVAADFFLGALTLQGFLAMGIAAWLAPVLVSPDLAHGAFALYLSRPFSRLEYVLGRLAALLVLLSVATWVPMLALFGLQAGLAPGWGAANLRLAWGMFLGAWVWNLVLALLGLAVAAAVRWRIGATGALFGVFFVGLAFAEVWTQVLRGPWGRLGNLAYVIGMVWRDLFGLPAAGGWRGIADPPLWAAWAVLGALALASVAVLHRRLVAREVAA